MGWHKCCSNRSRPICFSFAASLHREIYRVNKVHIFMGKCFGMQSFDIVIAGGGMVGLALACVYKAVACVSPLSSISLHRCH